MSAQPHEAVVRRAEERDVPGLVECSAGLFAEDGGTRDPGGVNINWPREHGPERFRQNLEVPERLTLVAEVGNQIAGHLTAVLSGTSPMKPITTATLVSMYVKPEWRRGQIGSCLVAGFMAWAKEQQADRVDVTAYASNPDAIKFYERHGFATKSVILEAQL
ncbi:GNAT family N-acetyltransferase [Streptomyces sp. DG2A-72]|uniref:GNAT family N-acetyltransferase n=1 Tax=Streptomyces sp. DG2A-72 TaxID=3051386 RepID=UPI00265BE790|nr:GNAT family N-acetyltransferase [Streptomyces sp. DG2A-72]MDO0935420.1 GNAT family N-acetyltransferase [Streptomyces sp. DG2A-72]